MTPKSPASVVLGQRDRDFALTPEKEHELQMNNNNENSKQDYQEQDEDMPLNLSTKERITSDDSNRDQYHSSSNNSSRSSSSSEVEQLHPMTSLNVTPPPLRAVNLKSSSTPQQQRQRSQGNIIWSPASMCERSARREQYGLKMEEQGDEEEHQVDPIVRKFKYERRTASISSLQSPISSLSAPASNAVQDLEFEVAQQQLYAHRSAFMAGLTGNNLELLTQHLKLKSEQPQQQQQQHRIKDEQQQENRSAAALMNLVAAAEFGYMRNQHQQPQQQQQQQQLHHQQQPQQHQHQQQHPDSTATDVARRSSSSSSYQGENEEKRSGRNFQVSKLKQDKLVEG